MTKAELIQLFRDCDPGIDGGEITIDIFDQSYSYHEYEVSYQIDDRIGRTDSSVEKTLFKKTGMSAKVDRRDAYPNGYAYYHATLCGKIKQ